MGPQLQNFTYLEGMQNFYFATTVDAYRITGNFCGNLISAVFCGQLRTEEIKIAEYYVK